MLGTVAPRFTKNRYPTTDGKPMAETDIHRVLMIDLIDMLQYKFTQDPNVYVSGNLLVFYEEGNRRRHVSPDCFVVFGVPNRMRPNYLIWEEGKSPNVVIELTSKSTRTEDTKKKFKLYENVLKVPEYFLFDPEEEYLTPSMQGYRLRAGRYSPIRPMKGRLPSHQLGLHLERVGQKLRFWNPKTDSQLPTFSERVDVQKLRAEAAEAELSSLKATMAKKSLNGHKNGHHE